MQKEEIDTRPVLTLWIGGKLFPTAEKAQQSLEGSATITDSGEKHITYRSGLKRREKIRRSA